MAQARKDTPAVPPDEVPGWETLLAAQLCGGKIEGKLRLVKILSILQLEGLPIPYRFEEYARGPHTETVVHRAKEGVDAQLLKIEMRNVRRGFEPRVDFVPTERGASISSQLLQYWTRTPEHEVYAGILNDVLNRYNFQMDGNAMSRHVHEMLLWDNEEDFRKSFVDLLNWFEKNASQFSAKAAESNEDLLAAAAAETALSALTNAEPKVFDDNNRTREDFVGIRYIRYLSDYIRQDLITWHGLHGEDCLKRLRQHLHALESNAVRYGFLEAIEDDEIESMLQEAGKSVHDLET